MSAATIRDAMVSDLEIALAPLTIHAEQPDALTPEAVTVEWLASSPADEAGFMGHLYALVVWPYTDLTASGPTAHYASRDRIVGELVEALRVWSAPIGAALTEWSAEIDERDLGGQTTRVAVVSATVVEAYLC